MGNLTEVCIPYVKFRLRVRAERRGCTQEVDEKAEVTQEAPESETALCLEPYDREFSFFDFRFHSLAAFAAEKPSRYSFSFTLSSRRVDATR